MEIDHTDKPPSKIPELSPILHTKYTNKLIDQNLTRLVEQNLILTCFYFQNNS